MNEIVFYGICLAAGIAIYLGLKAIDDHIFKRR